MNEDEHRNGQAEQLFEAIQIIARAFEEAPRETLTVVHAMLRDYFMTVTEPPGRQDNTVEQRVVGTLWAELEEVLDRHLQRFV